MIKLLLAILLTLTALLTVLPAPEFHLWLLAIMVTEFCWVFVLLSFALLFFSLKRGRYRLPVSILSGIAFLLFLSPLIRAFAEAGSLKQDMNKVFPSDINGADAKPFQLSKLFAAAPKVKHRTLSYVKYADTALTLDFYQSKMRDRRPCVIVIHGGSWSGGDSKQLPELNSLLAREGYNVASVNYRMAPKWKSPKPVEDVKNALNFLTRHAAALSVDTNKFVLLGRSAGAQVALLAAYTLKEQRIAGVIDFYGPADMVWGYSVPSSPLIMNSRKVMANYLGGPYPRMPHKYAASSPILFVDKTSAPTLILHGANDVLVAYEHSRRLNEKLRQADVPHYWLRLPWATHGFDYNINGPGGQLSTYAILRFLKAVAP
ncbi:MAG: alpha/beta hydrolase [Mucilaginibacter sp.]|nr:alpha/beta hydrolase [Mucilaginibacter sp.]